ESLSPDRQSGRLTRCVTELEEKLVRLGRVERPLNALSTHSLCQLGYRRDGRDRMSLPTACGVRCRGKVSVCLRSVCLQKPLPVRRFSVCFSLVMSWCLHTTEVISLVRNIQGIYVGAATSL